MRLKCLGSGSSGNCYLLESEQEALVIEAGVPFMEVKKALNFNIRKIAGVIISHAHGDHAKYMKEYRKTGIPIFTPYMAENPFQNTWFGKFYIKSFDVIHDVPCVGYVIYHEKMGRMVYATDAEYVRYVFGGLSHILVEANYSADLIDPNAANRSHVLTGHMELQTTIRFLQVNRNPELRNVILCHLSGNNADPEQFRQEAGKSVACDVHVAEKGLEVDVSLVPF